MKKLLIASLAAGALALSAPVAHADHVVFGCAFDTIAQETVTGGQDTFTGVLYGYAVTTTPGEWVGIRCFVRVDGTHVTPIEGDGPNLQVDTYVSQVTYTASDTQDVDVYARVLTGEPGNMQNHPDSNGNRETCFETTTTQIPPQEVIDLIDDILALTGVVDFLVCPILGGLAPGIPGAVNITGEGDVYILGIWFWDCPPYGV